jgi:hypothetical protein
MRSSMPRHPPPPESPAVRAARWALTGSCVALSAIAAAQIWAPAPGVFSWLLSDDGYYSLTIARSLGAGLGPTSDGIHLTSGFQPLWVVLLAPWSALTGGDRALLVRGALALHWLCLAVAAWNVSALARAAAAAFGAHAANAAAMAGFLYLSNSSLTAFHFNGLETGLLIALYSIAARWMLRIDWSSTAQVAALGAFCGLLVLTRIDAVFFVLLAVPICCLGRATLGPPRALLTLAVFGGCAFVVSSPWWLYNVMVFGTLMPQSGSAQADYLFPPGRILMFMREAMPTALPLPLVWRWPPLAVRIAEAAIAAAAILGAIAAARRVTAAREEAPPRVALLLGAAVVVKAAWYSLTSFAYWMYGRYGAPMAVLTLPITAAVLARTQRFAPVVMAIVLAAGWVDVWMFRRGPQHACFELRHYQLVELARRHAPESARIGALQSGALGFFRDGIVNLDGKVNLAALAARDDLLTYVTQERLDWLVDWDVLLKRDVFRSAAVPPEWRLVAAETLQACDAGTIAVYRRVANTSSGS